MTQRLPRPLAFALAALMAFAGLTLATPASAVADPYSASNVKAEFVEDSTPVQQIKVTWTDPAVPVDALSVNLMIYVLQEGYITEMANKSNGIKIGVQEYVYSTEFDIRKNYDVWIVHTYESTQRVEAKSEVVPLAAIPMISTSTAITDAPATGTSGTSTTITGSVTPSTATGSVQIKVNNNNSGYASLSNGTFSYNTILGLGANTVTATYLGDVNHTASAESNAVTITVSSAPAPAAQDPVTNIATEIVGTDLEISWTPPADLTTVLSYGVFVNSEKPVFSAREVDKVNSSVNVPLNLLSPGVKYSITVVVWGRSNNGVAFVDYTHSDNGSSSTPISTAPSIPVAPVVPPSARVQGVDRFATSAAISQEAFPEGNVPVAYVAVGGSFADSISGGAAAAAGGGPVLLVQGNSIPDSIKQELVRLDPDKIVIQAGTAAISDAVAAELAQYSDSGVTRNAGVDRYDTAVKAAQTFTETGGTVILTTGGNYPDALSASSLYASFGGPVLLVQPGQGISPAVQAEIDRLAPSRVFVLGGTAAVSGAVEGQVEALGFDAIRLGGANRYETSTAIADWVHTNAGYGTEALVATGTNFPDAMTAGSLAKVKNAPVLLSNGTCWHAEASTLIERMNPSKLTVLGGAAAQASGIEELTACM